MKMPFLNRTPRCDHCGKMDYRNAKLTKMLSWLCERFTKAKDEIPAGGLPDIIRENCELDSWWNDHQRKYQAELKREAEENEKKQKIKAALNKLNEEEKDLLGIGE